MAVMEFDVEELPDDPVLPEQFWNLARACGDLSREMRFWAINLTTGVQSAIDGNPDDQEWVNTPSDEIRGFDWMCELFGINGPAAREAIGKVLAGQRPELLTLKQVRALCGFSEDTILKRRKKGQFPSPVQGDGRGRRLFWRTADIDAWRRGQKFEPWVPTFVCVSYATAREIRRKWFAGGISKNQLARDYDISPQTVARIIRKDEKWERLDDEEAA